ncbi:MAG: S8 family serine peptidase, partial [Bacteroidales bacterium]|nr:S8 family serine peptidase [Bacteroidales bacterium]
RNILTALASAFGLACLTMAGGNVQAQTVNADYEDGGLYIRLKENTAFAVKSGENRSLNAARFNFLRAEMTTFGIQADVQSMAFADNDALSRTIAVTIDSVEDIDAFIERLRQYPEVELVEKRPVYYICGESLNADAPGDPLSAVIGGINHKWHLDVINADSAWKLATGKPNIKVAVIDNAIWEGHEDLNIAPDNLYTVHTRETGSAAPPADVDQTADCPELYNSKCPAYDWSHGTHCAGNVGAIRNNGKGVAAVGSGVTVMGVRCATNSVPGAVSNGFEGVRWAAEHGAKVISMSWGSRNQPNETEAEILKSCYDKGIILIAAAGNEAISGWFYPAASPYVISVGSVNSDKKYSSTFSNFGKWVDILAPGGFLIRAGQPSLYSVLSTTFCTNQNYRLKGDKTFEGMYYDGIYGTSMATPVAASLCGLLLSVDSTLNTHRMRELLTSTAQIINGNDRYVRDNSGLIDAFAAVKSLLNNRRPMPTDFRYTITPPKSMEMTWEAPKTGEGDPQVAYYRVYMNGNLIQDNLKETAFSTNDLKSGEVYAYSVEAVYTDNSVSLRDGIDFFMPIYYNIEVEIAPNETWGMVEGAGYYPEGDTVTLDATPAYGYAFIRWNDGDEVVSRQAIYKFAARYDVQLTPTFRVALEANEGQHAVEPLTVYPNPTDGTLYVENLPAGTFTGGIFDLQGRQLRQLNVQGGQTLSLPVAKLRKGSYIVKLTAADGTVRMAKFQKL